jgi:hypothetical protein
MLLHFLFICLEPFKTSKDVFAKKLTRINSIASDVNTTTPDCLGQIGGKSANIRVPSGMARGSVPRFLILAVE